MSKFILKKFYKNQWWEYQQHYKNEQKRVSQYTKQDEEYDDDPSEEEYEEYEVVEIPLWKRILNELRIPLFILIIVVLFSNCYSLVFRL